MDYTRLGTSGLKISRIALGCMSFADGGRQGAWALDAEGAEPIFRQAVELGITLWDTANIYGRGTSEEITGEAIRKYANREDVVLATKLFAPMGDGPGGAACPAGRSSSRSTPPSIGWAPTTSTFTRSTASTQAPRSPRRWRPCTTS